MGSFISKDITVFLKQSKKEIERSYSSLAITGESISSSQLTLVSGQR